MDEEIKVFLTFFIIFSYFAYWASWNEESTYSLVKSVVEENRFEIDTYKDSTGDRIHCSNNHYYSDKYPGLAFLSTPIYGIIKKTSIYFNLTKGSELFYFSDGVKLSYDVGFQINDISRLFLTMLTSSLFASLTVVLLFKFLKTQPLRIKKYRFVVITSFGIGSLLLPHSLVFTRHAITTFLFFFSLILIIINKKEKCVKKIFLSGCIYGIGILVSPLLIILSVPYVLYIKHLKKPVKYFIFGFSLGILPLLLYYIHTGFPVLPTFIKKLLGEYLPNLCWDQARVLYIRQSSLKNLIERFIFTSPQTLVYPSKGLFFYYPFLILLLFFNILRKKHTDEKFFLITSLLIVTIFISIMPLWWGGWSGYGPRYFSPIIPLFYLWSTGIFSRINWKIWSIPLILSMLTNFLLLQYGEDMIHELPSEIYIEKLKNFQILSNPLLEHYLPLFLKNGPRSMLFESLILDGTIDIRLSVHSCGLSSPTIKRDEIFLSSLPNSILTLRVPFLCLIPLILSLLFLWRNDILKKFKLNRKKFSIVLLVSLIMFTLCFLRIRTWIYGENWQSQELSGKKIEVNNRWMSQNASIILFNNNNKMGKSNLLFKVENFHKPRTLLIFLNDKQIGNYEINGTKIINQEMNLRPKKNEIIFYSIEGCDRPTELGLHDCDLRCLSFKISNIEIRNLE